MRGAGRVTGPADLNVYLHTAATRLGRSIQGEICPWRLSHKRLQLVNSSNQSGSADSTTNAPQ
ncbi:hypothetical protein Acidovoranil_13410 [Acidovorax sp. FG27]